MRRGGDYSWARPDPAALVAAGWQFVVRYVSDDRRTMGTPWEKNLDSLEALALSRAGLDIVLVWEGVAVDRDPLKGYAKGVADARAALATALALGAPARPVVYFAVDWNATADQFPAIGDYFSGVASVFGPDRTGCYGHTYLLRYLFAANVISYGWIPRAASWSYGLGESRAQLRQLSGATVGGSSVDLDDATSDDFGQWWRWDVAAWRVARSLEVLRDEIDAAYPDRSKASDGTIGDAAHIAQGSDSDHNPWVHFPPDPTGIVTALDITHDPAHGVDIDVLTDRLAATRDERIKYLIANRLIMSGAAGPSPWVWRPYSGTDPHTNHFHISVVADPRCDDTRPWDVTPRSTHREDGIEMFTLPEGFGCIGSADPLDITKAIVVPVDPGPGYVAWVSMAADFGTPTVRVATQQDGGAWGVKAYTYAGQRVSLGKYTIPGQLSVIRAAKDSTEMAAYQAALTALDDSYKQFKADKIPVGISVRYLPA